MSYMFEVYDKAPADPKKEAALSQQVLKHGGRLDYREDPEETGSSRAVIRTYEFDDFGQAEAAAEALRQQGEHVEGPGDYGA